MPVFARVNFLLTCFAQRYRRRLEAGRPLKACWCALLSASGTQRTDRNYHTAHSCALSVPPLALSLRRLRVVVNGALSLFLWCRLAVALTLSLSCFALCCSLSRLLRCCAFPVALRVSLLRALPASLSRSLSSAFLFANSTRVDAGSDALSRLSAARSLPSLSLSLSLSSSHFRGSSLSPPPRA